MYSIYTLLFFIFFVKEKFKVLNVINEECAQSDERKISTKHFDY